jgi:hypothetical protein
MTTAFRAAVMLSVLVGLPAAWMYYGPLPDRAQQIVDRFVAAAKEAVDWDRFVVTKPTVRSTAPSAGAAEAFAPTPLPAAPTIAPTPVVATPSPTPLPAGSVPTVSIASSVEPLLAKLRSWGVAKYALETWGSGGNLYRFHCEMPLAADAALTQQFEAVAETPRATIEQVVAEVTTWQLARQEPGPIR